MLKLDYKQAPLVAPLFRSALAHNEEDGHEEEKNHDGHEDYKEEEYKEEGKNQDGHEEGYEDGHEKNQDGAGGEVSARVLR